MLITAVDAHTGEPVVFDRHSGVDLVDAVAASCANGFGVPPYGIGDSRYIDGGYRANENADLAAGYGRVLVLSPLGGRSRAPLDWGMHLAAQVDELRARGSRVETILPDSNSRDAFGEQSDGSVDASARRSSRLQPRQSPCRAAHRILAPAALTEVITMGRTLTKRAADVLAYFDRPGTSNGPTKTINGRPEHLRGSALGFRNLTNYIARSLLEAGGFRPQPHPGL